MCMFSLYLGSLSLLSSVKLLPNPQVSQISLNSNSYICPILEEYVKKGGEMRLWELMKRVTKLKSLFCLVLITKIDLSPTSLFLSCWSFTAKFNFYLWAFCHHSSFFPRVLELFDGPEVSFYWTLCMLFDWLWLQYDIFNIHGALKFSIVLPHISCCCID